MKKAQRPFVIERKASRRREIPSKSIWGDTNLTALFEEVKSEIPALLPPSTTHGQDAATLINRVAPPPARPSERLGTQGVALPTSQPAPSPSPSGFEDISKDVNREAGAAHSVPKKILRSAGKIQPRADAGLPNSLRDELSALERENQELTRRMIEMLRSQNLWLKNMLRRFDVS